MPSQLPKTKKLLIAEDEKALGQMLAELFSEKGFAVHLAQEGLEAWQALSQQDFPLALVDLKMPGFSGLDILSRAQEKSLKTQIILMTAQDSMDHTVEAIKRGAFDYIAKPFELAEVEKLVEQAWQAWQQSSQNKARSSALDKASQENLQLIGKSPAIRKIYKDMGRVAASQVPVLISGESGTGKELVARAIHHYSQRQNKPFVAVNCAAIPKDLLESELFGHAQGAFTGANTKRLGYFEQAEGGTLFLDEVGELPLELQAKLLRVLQSGEIQSLGESQRKRLNLRILAATNRCLEEEVAQGRFREDLYFRLHVFPLKLPPLRERSDDIPLLAEYFLKKLAQEIDGPKKDLNPNLVSLLQKQSWPGNVRQLENTLKRAWLLSPRQILEASDLDFFFEESQAQPAKNSANLEQAIQAWAQEQTQEKTLYRKFLKKVEEPFLKQVLAQHRGRQSLAAKQLGINRNTLRKKLKELKILDD